MACDFVCLENTCEVFIRTMLIKDNNSCYWLVFPIGVFQRKIYVSKFMVACILIFSLANIFCICSCKALTTGIRALGLEKAYACEMWPHWSVLNGDHGAWRSHGYCG